MIKFCGLNFHDEIKKGEEKVLNFKDLILEHNPLNISYLNSGYFFEIAVTNDTNEMIVTSSVLMEKANRVKLIDSVKDVKIVDEFCYILCENGKVMIYNVMSKDLKRISCQEIFSNISATFDSLYGIAISNSLYQILPEFKLLHNFPQHDKILKIDSGLEHTLILTRNGDVYSFGCGLRGQHGNGDLMTYETPKLLEALAGIKIIDIACGAFHSVAVSSFNDVYSFGWNTNGQLGIKKSSQNPLDLDNDGKCQQVFCLPKIVDLDDEEDSIIKVFCGNKHTILKSKNNKLLSAGLNNYGQLSLGNCEDVDKFSEILIDKTIVTSKTIITCGYWTTYLINKI